MHGDKSPQLVRSTACLRHRATLRPTFEGLDGEFLPIWGRFVVALQHDGLNRSAYCMHQLHMTGDTSVFLVAFHHVLAHRFAKRGLWLNCLLLHVQKDFCNIAVTAESLATCG